MTLNKSFFLLAIGFLALCVFAGALVVASSTDGAGTTTRIVVIVAFAIAASVLWVQARQDLDAVLTLLSVCLLLVTMCATIYVFSADTPGIVSKAVAVMAGAGGIALGVTTYRRQRSESSEFPNVLGTRFRSDHIYETEGVQFTGFLQPGGNGKPHQIAILLQNCFDAARQVTIQLDAAQYSQYVRVQTRHQVTLGAAEVSKVTFPVVTPTYRGTYSLYLSMAVAGTDGRRVRLWRGREATTRVSTATTVALLAVGHLHTGGGISFTIGPLPDDLWAQPLSAPLQESLWQPRLGTVPLVQANI